MRQSIGLMGLTCLSERQARLLNAQVIRSCDLWVDGLRRLSLAEPDKPLANLGKTREGRISARLDEMGPEPGTMNEYLKEIPLPVAAARPSSSSLRASSDISAARLSFP
jgi:hypothetical protein